MVETSPQAVRDMEEKRPRTLRRRIRMAAVLAAAILLPIVALVVWCGSFERTKRFLSGQRLFVETESDTLRTDGDFPTLVRRIRIKNTAFETVAIVGCTES